MEASSLNFDDDGDPTMIGSARLGSSWPGLPPFAYSELPVGHIRLLTVNLRSAGLQKLKCTLCVVRWDSNVAYEALSYAWGKPILKPCH